MTKFYEPDLGSEPENPFARDQSGKLVRRSYWLDLSDQSLILVMTRGVGASLKASEKRVHLLDIARDHLVDECCQEILAPEKEEG